MILGVTMNVTMDAVHDRRTTGSDEHVAGGCGSCTGCSGGGSTICDGTGE